MKKFFGGAKKKAPSGGQMTDADYRNIKINDAEFNAVQGFAANLIHTTKYTLLTFLPKNLFEQFCRAANLYFLLIAILQSIPGLSPVSPLTSILPLVFVLTVTAVKEAIEDYRRFQMDKQINARSVQVLRGSELETIEWRHLVVGDIVMVRKGQQFPADLLMLASSDSQGVCYIETMNLDGETNLKVRECLGPTAKKRSPNEFSNIRASIVCEQPNNSLYTFDGKITLDDDDRATAISTKQILLRGCTLRNTDWICGIAIFTGHETKLMQNASDPPTKRSKVERKMNRLIFILFAVLAAFCTICAVGNGIWVTDNQGPAWYLTGADPASKSAPLAFLAYLILYNIMIPISLYVSMEMVKVFHAFMINADLTMYHEETDTPARARTSNLGEELGQIDFIFSDKTGTLTCNVMEFLKCSIGGVSYGTGSTEIGRAAARRLGKSIPEDKRPPGMKFEKGFNFYDPRVSNVAWKHQNNSHVIREFLSLLAVCHTVIPDGQKNQPDRMVYQAASPDEAALVAAGKNLGFYFHTRTPHAVIVHLADQQMDVEYQVLNILEFDSTRKRMSVVCRCPDGKLRIYCKGADTVIYERLAESSAFKQETQRDLQIFADEGLRTLCLSVAELDEDYYAQWNAEYYKASISLDKREEKINACAEKIERNLHLLGATAIEDKLQAGVPDCIATLARANIKIFVLTGDKQETAINIGFACSLLTPQMDLLIINEGTSDGVRKALETYSARIHAEEAAVQQSSSKNQMLAMGPVERGLVIDGASLFHALHDDLKMVFLDVCTRCKATICCRVSPLQKSMVVKLVKDNIKCVTLAIGDGANDVPMIQAAHVGIGISGQEGMQAVLASDYAIAQFRFLQRLLLVHGRWSFQRVAKLINYSFYKNMAFALTQFWFACFTGFSGTTLHDSWHIALFNVIYTSLPIMFVAVFDRDIPASLAEANPELYVTSQRSMTFTKKVFLFWILDGVYGSAVYFFVPAGIFSFTTAAADSTGRTMDGVWAVGTICYTCLVLGVNLKLLLETKYLTRWTIIVTLLTMLSWFLVEMIYNALTYSFLASIGSGPMYMLIYELMAIPDFWLCVALALVMGLLPAYLFRSGVELYAQGIGNMTRELFLRGLLGAHEGVVSGAGSLPNGGRISPTLGGASAASLSSSSGVLLASKDEEKGLIMRPSPTSNKLTPAARFRKAAHAVHGMSYMQGRARQNTGYAFSQEKGNFLFPLSANEEISGYARSNSIPPRRHSVVRQPQLLDRETTGGTPTPSAARPVSVPQSPSSAASNGSGSSRRSSAGGHPPASPSV